MLLTSKNRTIITTLGLLGACTLDSAEHIVSLRGSDEPLPEFASTRDAAWVFDETQVRTYELSLDAEAWAELQAHALDEQYTRARLSIDGQTVGVVGLRYKGNAGTLRRCARDGMLLCPKLSMKLRFDEYDPELRFYGLKRLNFHSMLADASHLRERLAYRLFREMGVVAPRAGHARLVVNGEALGVFSLVEAIDGRFTDNHFEAGDGNLYKEQWPDTESPDRLSQGLETNEEIANHSGMIELSRQLSASAPEQLSSVLERYVDVESLLSYLVVDRAIKNWDGVTAFYGRGGAGRNHNYYLYQHEARPYFSLIPWDLDNTFRLFTPFDYVPSPLVVPADCSLRYPAFSGLVVSAPGCDPLLQGLARMDPERHRERMTRLLEGPFALDTLSSWVDATQAQLAPYVAEDDRGPTSLQFQQDVKALRRELRLLHLRLAAEQQGQTVEPVRVDVEAPNDFEAATSLGVQLGVIATASAATHVEIDLRDGPELGGSRHLELSFDLGDGEDRPLRYSLPFNSAALPDLNLQRELRLRLQSSAPRKFRISFASSGYSQYLSPDTFGWTVELTGAPEELILPLQSAQMPEGVALPDSLEEVLRLAFGLLIDPVVGDVDKHDRGGELSDAGWLRVDDIVFVPVLAGDAP